MRRFLSKTFIFIGVLSLVLGTLNSFGRSISYAEDLELIGTDLGLEIIPTSTKLFDLNRLNPGDTKEAKITIKNNYRSSFYLYMRAERMSPIPEEGDIDLFEQLNLTVYLHGNIVYSGSMKDFATSSISLGVFNPNDIKDLNAAVYLPGPETGNEFQGAGVEVKWIFIAESDVPTEEPEEPEESEESEEFEEQEEIIEDRIPETIPEENKEEIIGERIPEVAPKIIEEEEIIEEKIPQSVLKMPRTGEIPSSLFYGAGMLFLFIGVQMGFKRKK
ncbi:hypothetical protein [Tissierella sp.]|uniref:hypothetical protein n=1 Tax=Tissierella sp. TaxID=41274 RepID=UPI00304E3E12